MFLCGWVSGTESDYEADKLGSWVFPDGTYIDKSWDVGAASRIPLDAKETENG